MLSYGDRLRFAATDDEGNRRVFVLQRSGAVNSRGWKLYGYDPERNELNQLEDFGMASDRPTLAEIEEEAKSRISFYVGEGYDIRSVGGDVS